jgi:diacylglycerol diphosphate phosphatase/phosphatidate phosphatase
MRSSSSSSEDDVTNGYEMRHGNTMGQNPGAGHHVPQYDNVVLARRPSTAIVVMVMWTAIVDIRCVWVGLMKIAGHHVPQYDPSNAYVSQTQPLTADAGIHVPDGMAGQY